MKIPTCGECRYWIRYKNNDGDCDLLKVFKKRAQDHQLCTLFIGKDGKRPRFCKFAKNLYTMACAFVDAGASGNLSIDDMMEWLSEMDDAEVFK